ncbi:hypothetical protein Tco_1084793 [Tanacetum coccineum]
MITQQNRLLGEGKMFRGLHDILRYLDHFSIKGEEIPLTPPCLHCCVAMMMLMDDDGVLYEDNVLSDEA